MNQESQRSLDEIMSREPVTDPVQETTTPAVPEPVEQGQPRDETGKFTPKQQEPAAGESDGVTDEAAQAAVEGGKPEKGTVPLQALHAARDKEKTARDEADALRRELAELRGQVSVLTQQRPQPQPAEAPKPKTLWEDPDAFVAERNAPIQQEVIKRHFMTSRMLADEKYGSEAVKEADDALGAVIQANPNDPEIIALQQRVQASEHPYRDLVTWHQRRKALAEIGDDPQAYEAKVRERIMAEMTAATPAPPTQQPAAKAPMPTNFAGARNEGQRSSVAYQGPKPLSDITKGSAQ